MAESKAIEAKRQQCWDRALEAYGTAFLFERRSARMRAVKRFFTFLGILAHVWGPATRAGGSCTQKRLVFQSRRIG
jgi:hypothetical protein